MQYKVVVGTLFIAGVKYTRGQVVELSPDVAVQYGVRIEEQPEVKPAPVRKSRKKAEVSDEDS